MTEDMRTLLQRAAAVDSRGYDGNDVERRAGRLRRNHQRAAGMVAAAVVLVVSVSSIAAVRAWRTPSTAPSAGTTGSATPSPLPPQREFVPATRIENGAVVMPLTFLDGTTAEIVYPPDLDIAGMGAVPYSSGRLYDPPINCCARDFAVSYDQRVPSSLEPVKEYPGVDGRPVRFFEGPGPDYLVFEIGDWRLAVWDGAGGALMSDEARAMWSANMSGRVSIDGFPVLTATAPVRLQGPGESHGPEIGFSSSANGDGNSIEFRPSPECPAGFDEPQIEEHSGGQLSLILCRPQWSMMVNASGDRAFVLRVVEALDVRNVRFA